MAVLYVDQVDPQSGTTLTIGTSGDTVTVPSGVTVAGGLSNAPAWSAKVTSDVTGQSWNSTIILPCATEAFDTDGAYDTSTYRFTVPSDQAGKYLVSLNANAKSASGGGMRTLIYGIRLNGSTYRAYQWAAASDIMEDNQDQKRHVTGVLDLSVSDYVDTYIYAFGGSGSLTIKAETYFEGFKLIG